MSVTGREIFDKKAPHYRALGDPYMNVLEQAISKKLGDIPVLGVRDTKKIFIIALGSLGIGPGDEVIVPAFCSSIIISPLLRVGAVPVFCDIRLDDYSLDPALIEEKITARTKAILIVHHFGQPALGTGEILKIAKRRSLLVIEGATQSFGAKIEIDGKQKFVGTLGDVGCTRLLLVKSFERLKNISVGILSFSEKSAAYGIAKRDRNLSDAGYVFRMDQMTEILGNFQFLDTRKEKRKKIAEYYMEQLSDVKDIILPGSYRDTEHTWSRYVIRTEKRDALMAHLSQSVGPIFTPQANSYSSVPRMEYQKGNFPMSEKAISEILFLPISGSRAAERADQVIGSIRAFFRQ